MARMNKVGPLSDRVLEDIQGMSPGDSLPSSRVLCRRYGVAPVTLARACRRLSDQGHLDVSQGRRMRIPGGAVGVVSPAGTTVDSVASALRERVSEGRYRAGRPMPKQVSLAAEFGVSRLTLSRALEQLSRRGVLHRAGRQWVVGGTKQSPAREPGSLTVVLIQPEIRTWQGLQTERTRKFVDAFSSELEMRSLRFVACAVNERSGGTGPYPAGPSALLETIDALGSRYAGAIVAGQPGQFDDMEQAIRLALSFRRGVVWFDSWNTPTPTLHNRLFCRAHFSESALAVAAIDFVAGSGHRGVGYIDLMPDPWVHTRKELLRRELARRDPSAAFVPAREAGRELLALTNNDMAQRLERAHRSRRSCARLAVQRLLELTPDHTYVGAADLARGLYRERAARPADLTNVNDTFSLLLDERVSVVIAPRDQAALPAYSGLHRAGVAVPRDISLLSFDNYYYSGQLPVTTIDIGADWLGYQALHWILGDIPVRARNGEIVAMPRIVDRGSVADVRGATMPRTP